MRKISALLRSIMTAVLIASPVLGAAASSEIEELNRKGKAASESRKLEEALSYFAQSLEIARRMKDKPATAEALHFIGLVQVYLNQYEKSLPFYQESLALYEELKDRQGVAANLHMLGVAFSEIGQYEKARDFYERALEIRRRMGDPNQLIPNLINLGGVHRFLGKNEKALFYLEEALAEARKLNSDERLGPVLYNIGGVYVSVGQPGKGLGYFEEALKLGEKLHKAGLPGYDGFIAKCLGEIGSIYASLGQQRKALGYAEKALKMRKEIGLLPLEVAANLSMIGAIYHSLGQYDQALPYHEQALDIRKRYTIPQDIVESLNNIGTVYFDLSRYDQALSFFEEAQAINRKLNLEQRLALSATYIGSVFYVTGRYDKALVSYEEALRIRRKLDIPQEIASSLHDIAGVFSSQGQYERSLRYYKEALKARRALNLPQETELTLREIVRVYLLQHKYKEAEQIAVSSLQELYNKTEIRLKGNAPLVEVYLVTGRYDQALSLLQQMAPDWNNPDSYRIQFHSQKGLALRGKGRFKEASKELLAAISLSEEMRNKVRGKAGFFETSFATGHLRAYRAIVECIAERAMAGEAGAGEFAAYGDTMASAAFYFAEATKARVLLEAVSSGFRYEKAELPGDIKRRERELLGRSASIEARWSEALKKGEAAFTSVKREKEALKKEFSALLKEMRDKYPKYAYLAYPDPVPVEKLPLGRSEVLLHYEVNDDTSYVFKVAGGKPEVMKIPIGKDKLEQLVRQFTRVLQTPQSDALSVVGPGHDLYNILMASALKDIPADKEIIIVPDGILGLLPFEALVMNPGKDLQDTVFVGDRRKTSYSQSATVLASIRNSARPKLRKILFAIGDPLFDRKDPRYAAHQKGDARTAAPHNDAQFSLSMRGIRIEDAIMFPPLPETRKEILKIAALFNVVPRPPDVLLDLDASETEMKKALSGEYEYMHFATHGYLSSTIQGVKEPILVLSQVENKGKDDGLLTMSEVLDMNLNADLVTLSSCASGVGKFVEGEGISNFARAFQHAGARSVVISLWEVASNETAEYMVLFYKQIKDGKDKKTALASARSAIRVRYPHPFYWAPFVIYGENQ